MHYRLLLAMAARRLWRRWPYTLALLAGSILATATLAAAPLYADVLRTAALRQELEELGPVELTLQLAVAADAVDRIEYQGAQAELDGAVARALGAVGTGLSRSGATAPLLLTAQDLEPPPRETRTGSEPAAVLQFRSLVEDHLTVVAGVFPEPVVRDEGAAIPVAADATAAAAASISVGDRFDLHALDGRTQIPITVVVVALVQPTTLAEAYWLGERAPLRDPGGDVLTLLLPEATFFGALADLAPTGPASYESTYRFDALAATADRADELAAGVVSLAALSDTTTASPASAALVGALETFDDSLFFTRRVVLLLAAQLLVIHIVVVVAVASALRRALRSEHELLQLRGATSAQLRFISVAAAIPSVLIALAAGPFVAAGGIRALALIDAFDSLPGADVLSVAPTVAAFAWSAVAALAVLAALVATQWRNAVRTSRRADRGRRGMQVALVAAVAGLVWLLSRDDQLLSSPTGAVQIDYAVLLLPGVIVAAFAFAASGLPALRLASRVPRPPLTGFEVGFALLTAGVALAILSSSLGETITRSPGDRAAYRSGADVRISGLYDDRAAAEIDEAARTEAALDALPAEATSPVARLDGTLITERGSATVTLLGVEPSSLQAAATAGALDPAAREALRVLATNTTSLDGLPLPAGARQVGAWVQLAGLRDGGDGTAVVLRLRDGGGRFHDVLLDRTSLSELPAGEWEFRAADLRSPTLLDDEFEAGPGPPLGEPLTLHSYFLIFDASTPSGAGEASLGPVLATLDPPSALPSGLAFPRRTIVSDLVHGEDFDPLSVLSPRFAVVQASPAPSAPPGFGSAIRMSWQSTDASTAGPFVRGLQHRGDGAPLLLFVSEPSASALAVAAGDTARLQIAGRAVEVQIAGLLDRFATLDPAAGFAVADLGRLAATFDVTPGSQLPRPAELWLSTSDPSATIRAAGSLPGTPIVSQLADQQSELAADDRFAAGWEGALTLAAWAAVAAALLAVIVAGGRVLRAGTPDGEPGFGLPALALALVAALILGGAAGVLATRAFVPLLEVDVMGETRVLPLELSLAAPPLLGALAVAAVAWFAAVAVRATAGRRQPTTRDIVHTEEPT